MAKAPSNAHGNSPGPVVPVADNNNGKKQLDEAERQKDNSSGSEEGTLSSESNTVNSASQVDNSNTHAVRWDQMFVRLQEFKQKHGHCRVPNRYKPDPSLGSWVSAQRRQYKIVTSGQSGSTAMTMERAKRLSNLGFEWSTSNPNHVSWETRFEELQSFVKAHGHAQVPMRWQENEQLSNWVSKQRQDYKLLRSGQSSRLSEERLKLLRDIGFVWEVDRATSRQLKGAVLKTPPEPSIPHAFPVSIGDSGGGSLTTCSDGGSSRPASDVPTEPTSSSTDTKVHSNGTDASPSGTGPEESQHTARAERTEDTYAAAEETGITTVPAREDTAQQCQPKTEAQQDDTKQSAAGDVTASASSSPRQTAELEESDVASPEDKAVPATAELCLVEESLATDSAVQQQGVASPPRKDSRKTVSRRGTGSSEPEPRRRSKRRKGNG